MSSRAVAREEQVAARLSRRLTGAYHHARAGRGAPVKATDRRLSSRTSRSRRATLLPPRHSFSGFRRSRSRAPVKAPDRRAFCRGALGPAGERAGTHLAAAAGRRLELRGVRLAGGHRPRLRGFSLSCWPPCLLLVVLAGAESRGALSDPRLAPLRALKAAAARRMQHGAARPRRRARRAAVGGGRLCCRRWAACLL